MADSPDEHTPADKKLFLKGLQARSVPSEIGPVRFLPVPVHER